MDQCVYVWTPPIPIIVHFRLVCSKLIVKKKKELIVKKKKEEKKKQPSYS